MALLVNNNIGLAKHDYILLDLWLYLVHIFIVARGFELHQLLKFFFNARFYCMHVEVHFLFKMHRAVDGWVHLWVWLVDGGWCDIYSLRIFSEHLNSWLILFLWCKRRGSLEFVGRHHFLLDDSTLGNKDLRVLFAWSIVHTAWAVKGSFVLRCIDYVWWMRRC